MRQVVARREADDPASPALSFGDEQAILGRSVRVSGRRAAKSFVKTNVALVFRIALPPGPGVARAEVALGS